MRGSSTATADTLLVELMEEVTTSCCRISESAHVTRIVVARAAKYRKRVRWSKCASPRAVAIAVFMAGPANGAISIAATRR
jgi:hypothetical protein